MPRYLVERTFCAPARAVTAADGRAADHCDEVIRANAREGVTWIHSFVTPDRCRSFCIVDSPSPRRSGSPRRPPPCRSTASPRCGSSIRTSSGPALPINGGHMKPVIQKSQRAFAAAVVATLCLSGAIGSARADAVMDWNATAAALPIAVPPVHARVMAAMHGAVHDAVNAIEPHYETYRFPVEAPAGASKDAAVATAAHGVLSALVPSQKAALDTALAQSLAKISDERSKADGIVVGKSRGRAHAGLARQGQLRREGRGQAGHRRRGVAANAAWTRAGRAAAVGRRHALHAQVGRSVRREGQARADEPRSSHAIWTRSSAWAVATAPNARRIRPPWRSSGRATRSRS